MWWVFANAPFWSHPRDSSDLLALRLTVFPRHAPSTLAQRCDHRSSHQCFDHLFPLLSVRFCPAAVRKNHKHSMINLHNLLDKTPIPPLGESLRVFHIGGYWRRQNDTVRHMMLG